MENNDEKVECLFCHKFYVQITSRHLKKCSKIYLGYEISTAEEYRKVFSNAKLQSKSMIYKIIDYKINQKSITEKEVSKQKRSLGQEKWKKDPIKRKQRYKRYLATISSKSIEDIKKWRGLATKNMTKTRRDKNRNEYKSWYKKILALRKDPEYIRNLSEKNIKTKANIPIEQKLETIKKWQQTMLKLGYIVKQSIIDEDYVSRSISRKKRLMIFKRDDCRCQKCGKKLSCKKDYRIHHIIPFRLSKNSNVEILILLCPSCHIKEEWKIFRIIKDWILENKFILPDKSKYPIKWNKAIALDTYKLFVYSNKKYPIKVV